MHNQRWILLPIVIIAHQLHDGVRPTLQELEKFEATPEEVELEGEQHSGLAEITIL